MLKLTVTEKLYQRGTPWVRFSLDEEENTIASENPYDGELLRDQDGRFSEDKLIRFYKITCDMENEEDFSKMETILGFRMKHPGGLRYWFHDVPTGIYELITGWYPGGEHRDNQELEFVEAKPIVDISRKEAIKLSSSILARAESERNECDCPNALHEDVIYKEEL